MTPIEHFYQEHELLARVVDALELFVSHVEQGAHVERQDLVRFVTFFREFSDLGHHEKEESILIPAMVRSGCGWDDGPIAEIRKEHDHERYLMRSLRQVALQKDPWSEEARRRLINVSNGFIEFLRAHMLLEDRELLPKASVCLSAEAAAEVAGRLEAFDSAWDAKGELAWLRELAAELTERYASA